MKKILCSCLTLCLAVMLLGTAMASDNSTIRVGYAFSNVAADAYHTAHANEDIRYAAEKGIEFTLLDATDDIDLQIRQIEDMIEMKVDVLMVWPCDTNAVVPALKKAYDAGIPVIVNVKVSDEGMQYVTSFVGADYYSEGVLAGQLTKEYFEKNVPGDGVVNLVELSHLPGNLIAQQRGDGFREGIEGSAVPFEIMESNSPEGSREKATQLMENYIIKYGDTIDCVYIQGDSIAHGAMNAIADAGMSGDIAVVGISLAAESYERLKNGEMYASVLESPLESARSMIDTAIAIANGEEVPDTVYIKLGPVTQEVIGEIEKPSW